MCLRGRRRMVMEKVNLQQRFCQCWRASTLIKYLVKFIVNNTVAAFSSIENKVYRVQQKVKKQQFTLTHVEEVKWVTFVMQCIELDYIFNVIQY
jgi:hypothetical protein